MFCGNCGKEIEDGSKFCPFCGSGNIEEEIVENNISDNNYQKIFVEPDENYLGSLGDGYLNSFFTTNKIKTCIAFLSDKRVYLRGNMIDINGGKFSRTNIQKTIDLEDITGTGFIYISGKLWKLILAILLGLLTIWLGLPLLTMLVERRFELVELVRKRTIECVFYLLFCLLTASATLIPAILLFLSYFKARKTLFFIEYAGGCIKFDASIYGLAESQDFEKQIRRAKNKVKENK